MPPDRGQTIQGRNNVPMIPPSTSAQAGDEGAGGPLTTAPDTALHVSSSEAAAVIKAILERLQSLDNDLVKVEGAAELAAQPDMADFDTTDYPAILTELRQERHALRAVLDRLR